MRGRRRLGQDVAERRGSVIAQHGADAAGKNRDRERDFLSPRQGCRIRAAQERNLALLQIVEAIGKRNLNPLHGQRGKSKLGLHLMDDLLAQRDRVPGRFVRSVTIGKWLCVRPITEGDLPLRPDPVEIGACG